MIIRQRDIRAKEKQIADIKHGIDVCNRYGVLAGKEAELYNTLKSDLEKAQNELKQMKVKYAEYEAMFSR